MIKIDIFEYERSDNQTFSIGSIFANAQSTTSYATDEKGNFILDNGKKVPVGGTIDISKVNIPSTTQSFLANKSKLRKNQRTIYLLSLIHI